jgi:hypothetical protein
MVGPLIVNQGKVVRPSQLIRGVRPTCSECDEGAEQAAKDVRGQ